MFSLCSPGFASGCPAQPLKVPLDQLGCEEAAGAPVGAARLPRLGSLSTKFYYFYPALLWKITAGSPAKEVTEISSKDIKPHGLGDFVLYFNKT